MGFYGLAPSLASLPAAGANSSLSRCWPASMTSTQRVWRGIAAPILSKRTRMTDFGSDRQLRGVEFWAAGVADGSSAAGRSYCLAAREQAHGQRCLCGEARLNAAGIGLLAEQLPPPGHRWRRRRFSQATPPVASARDPLPASPTVGRMSRIRKRANCALGAAHQRSQGLCQAHRPPPGPRRDLLA